VVDSLKALDPKRPIREADIADAYPGKPVNLPLCGSDGLLRAMTLR
jgi:hypothetical protein